ncbi:hypothetical protein GCM10010458_23770 [Microbacterium luteolum]|uniref:hypothetical protein n=1 Tax=Microbacterium luteolum TaxID=69367 RepID=UPI00249C89D4|nr:hypothetical protein [Microbacterium luteolum]
MIIRKSALKHGINEDDCRNAAAWAALTVSLDNENPGRQLRLGFDSSGRLLELIVLVWDAEPKNSSTPCERARSMSVSSVDGDPRDDMGSRLADCCT